MRKFAAESIAVRLSCARMPLHYRPGAKSMRPRPTPLSEAITTDGGTDHCQADTYLTVPVVKAYPARWSQPSCTRIFASTQPRI